jgi:hypothetical protein
MEYVVCIIALVAITYGIALFSPVLALAFMTIFFLGYLVN